MSFSFVNEAATGSAETLTAEWCQYFACRGRCAPADAAVKTALSNSLVGVAALLRKSILMGGHLVYRQFTADCIA